MQCQIPGCKNKGTKKTAKNGIFCGVHLDNVFIWICNKHSFNVVNTALQITGEEYVSEIQKVNPFLDVQKICKKFAKND